MTTKTGTIKTGKAKTDTAKTDTGKTGKAGTKTDPDEETRPEDEARTEEAADAEEKSAGSTDEGTSDDVPEDTGEDAPEAEDEAVPAPRDGPAGRRGTRWAGRAVSAARRVSSVHRSRASVVLVLLALAATTVTATLQWREAGRLSQEADTRQRVGTRAAEFGQALLAYEHTDLDGSRARIRQLTATDFGRSYEAAFDGLAAVIGKYKADATATVRDTYVNEIEGDRAKALVVLDSEVRSTAGTRRVLGSKLLLELVREKGQWRVSGLVSLEADHESMTKPDGTPASPEPSDGDPAVPPGSPEKP
ncbi:hypothetical protein [Actinomadura sp. 7K507]|uniref:hypothetical protein n=1 Tax=Actinomadura sp. 7K507 TaxID=2530365 RepID=UPI0010537E19|nr:hypothetical protein [Actinomadura sp. 7K507]TDC97928.1 hypothetical protein E1285_01700 [Actinomadura sp. 7K507]